jgi:hypothetical protein
MPSIFNQRSGREIKKESITSVLNSFKKRRKYSTDDEALVHPQHPKDYSSVN